MAQPFLGEIRLFGGNYAPANWALCNGQQLSIAQNQPLFSLIGTAFGGDGRTTFQLPNLQSRIPIGQGQGPGLTNRVLSQFDGMETVTLQTANMPQHTHIFAASPAASTSTTISTSVVLATSPSNGGLYAQTGLPGAGQMNPTALTSTGGSQGHPNIMPYLTITYIIALQGVYPSRN